MTTPKIGIQMYTLRDHAAQNFTLTLERVAQTGVEGVEFAGFGGMSAPDLKALLERLNLKAAGAHFSSEQLFDELQKSVDYALELGLSTIVCPYARFETAQEWLEFAAKLETVAQSLKTSGITLLYHNHDHELTQKIGAKTVLDALLEAAPSVGGELDVAWLEVGGYSAAEYLTRYAARTPLIHLKDYRRKGSEVETVELGQGETHLDAALEAGKGAQWWLIEQDQCAGDPFDSLKVSLEWLKANWG